jgi:hypothetical protein
LYIFTSYNIITSGVNFSGGTGNNPAKGKAGPACLMFEGGKRIESFGRKLREFVNQVPVV